MSRPLTKGGGGPASLLWKSALGGFFYMFILVVYQHIWSTLVQNLRKISQELFVQRNFEVRQGFTCDDNSNRFQPIFLIFGMMIELDEPYHTVDKGQIAPL